MAMQGIFAEGTNMPTAPQIKHAVFCADLLIAELAKDESP